MNITEKIIDMSIKQELAKSYNNDVASVKLGEIISRTYNDGLLTVMFSSCEYTLKNGEIDFEDGKHNFNFTIGIKTPKGYKSKKEIPVTVLDGEKLTDSEVELLMGFCNEFKVNTFDPFYIENEAARRNAAGWSYVAQNFITDLWCTN